MSATATSLAPKERLEGLFDELAELTGQRNVIDSRIVEIAAEIERDQLAGGTGARSVAALMAWKTGVTARNAETVVAIARRLDEFPPVSYTHLTLPTKSDECRSRWSPYH